MTREDLFCAIGAADEKDLIQAQKKRISPVIWFVAAAAVLLLLSFLIHRQRPTEHTILEEKPSWSMDVDVRIVPKSVLLDETVQSDFLVHARVLEVLPDTYLIPEKTLNRQACRVLRLQVVQTLFGKNVPNELYYIHPEEYFTDMTGLDLIISMDQLGVEDYLLLNTSSQQYETFSLLFADFVNSNERDLEPIPDPTRVSTGTALSNILPFRNNRLYWLQSDYWSRSKSYFEFLSKNGDIPLTAEHTLVQAKTIIRQMYAGREEPTVRYADEYNFGIQLTDADTPKEGVFSQIIHQYDKKILLCRIIDGYYTNECYMYYEDGRIEASDTKFTQEEIATLPKLTPAVHQTLEKAPENGTCRSFVGYYYKTNQGNLYGIVQAVWSVSSEPDVTVNMLVKLDGSVTQVSDKVLEAYLADDLETAALQEVWDSVSRKAYRSMIIYQNREIDYVSLGRETILHENFTITCNDSWYAAAEIKLTQVSPSVIDLENLISETPKYWHSSDWNKQRLVNNIRYAWQLEQDVTDHRKSQYLLYMQDGALLLIRCYDYSQIFNDPAKGLQIPQIVELEFYYDY